MNARIGRILVLALVAVVVVGCGAGAADPSAGVTGAPTSSDGVASPRAADSPSASVVPDTTDCRNLYLSIDEIDPTLANLRTFSPDVIVGTVTGAGEPFWDSPTGQGPKPGEQLGEGNEFYILTPYVVTVDRALAGRLSPGEVTVVIEGGKIGCSKLDVSPAVTLTPKTPYVIFLRPWTARAGTKPVDHPLAHHAWPIEVDGTVLTPLDGAISLDALSKALAPDAQTPTP
jgi:hypothetical protein